MINFGSPSTIVAAENSGGLGIALTPGFRALGSEIGGIFSGGTIAYTLTDTSGILDAGMLSVTQVTNFNGPNTTFFGWISDTNDLVSLNINFIGSEFESIDNVIYGNGVRSVPEPASAAMVGLGVLGLLVFARRRRSAVPMTSKWVAGQETDSTPCS